MVPGSWDFPLTCAPMPLTQLCISQHAQHVSKGTWQLPSDTWHFCQSLGCRSDTAEPGKLKSPLSTFHLLFGLICRYSTSCHLDRNSLRERPQGQKGNEQQSRASRLRTDGSQTARPRNPLEPQFIPERERLPWSGEHMCPAGPAETTPLPKLEGWSLEISQM